MDSKTSLMILNLPFLLPVVACGSSLRSPNGRTHLLPWEMIVEKFNEGCTFSGDEDSMGSNMPQCVPTVPAGTGSKHGICCKPSDAMTVRFPAGFERAGASERMSVSLDKYATNSWQKVSKVKVSTERDKVKITHGVGEEGFFRLSCAVHARNGRPHDAVVYAIVCSNWKKDTLSFCRKLKEDIEFNPDVQLVRSCIAISHFDHTMKKISEASVLSDDALRALSAAIESKRDFDAGRYPALVVGWNKIRLKRFDGSPIQEFVILIPDDYEDSKAWPVFVHTDVQRRLLRDNYPSGSGLIDLWWHTISYKDIRWKDFVTVMRIIKEQFNVDEDRMYVHGECLNGIDAMALALNYPDRWAECSSSLGNSYRYLAGNALNLPLIFAKGSHIEGSLVGYYNYALKCFQYHGCRHLKFSDAMETAQARGALIPRAVREKAPRRVVCTIESLGNSRSYWVKVDGREDENQLGTIDACVDGQTIQVRTNNVDAYSLNLVQAPLDSNKPVEIVEDGQSLGFVTEQVFAKRCKKYVDAAHIKNDQLHGPVWDAFTDPYVVVYGTRGGDVPFVKTCKDIAKELARGAPCLGDVDMSKKTMSSHNLILVGSVESNRWLARISGKLPVQIMHGQVHTTDGKSFKGNDLAYVVIYPNPMNPDKYVVVYSATSDRAMANVFRAYLQMRAGILADIGIFEIADHGNIKWHILEKLNTVWNWHGSYEKVLASVGRDHPKWQWKQWVAHIVRKQMQVDVAICEDHLRNLDALSPGEKTYRDMFNAFQNTWFTKVKMDGKSLRAIMLVPFGSISKRNVKAPIIDGICLVKNPMAAEAERLAISELEDETIYTVAFSEKCLNGQRMGVVILDYDIIEQRYFLPTLKEYLEHNSKINIDIELDNVEFRTY